MTEQPDLCRTCSETTLLVFSQDGSFIVIYTLFVYIVMFLYKYFLSKLRKISFSLKDHVQSGTNYMNCCENKSSVIFLR